MKHNFVPLQPTVILLLQLLLFRLSNICPVALVLFVSMNKTCRHRLLACPFSSISPYIRALIRRVTRSSDPTHRLIMNNLRYLTEHRTHRCRGGTFLLRKWPSSHIFFTNWAESSSRRNGTFLMMYWTMWNLTQRAYKHAWSASTVVVVRFPPAEKLTTEYSRYSNKVDHISPRL